MAAVLEQIARLGGALPRLLRQLQNQSCGRAARQGSRPEQRRAADRRAGTEAVQTRRFQLRPAWCRPVALASPPRCLQYMHCNM